MDIRQVNLQELAGVLALIDQYDRPQSPHPSAERLAQIYESLQESGGCVVGAFTAAGIVGTCTVNLCANLSWSGRPYATLENVIVSKQHRREGIGRAVISFALSFAAEAGCYKAVLLSGSKDAAVHHFYEAVGFIGGKEGYQVRFSHHE